MGHARAARKLSATKYHLVRCAVSSTFLFPPPNSLSLSLNWNTPLAGRQTLSLPLYTPQTFVEGGVKRMHGIVRYPKSLCFLFLKGWGYMSVVLLSTCCTHSGLFHFPFVSSFLPRGTVGNYYLNTNAVLDKFELFACCTQATVFHFALVSSFLPRRVVGNCSLFQWWKVWTSQIIYSPVWTDIPVLCTATFCRVHDLYSSAKSAAAA